MTLLCPVKSWALALRVPKTSSALATAGLIIANDLAPRLSYAAHGIIDVSWA
jgi:hypothetical protein